MAHVAAAAVAPARAEVVWGEEQEVALAPGEDLAVIVAVEDLVAATVGVVDSVVAADSGAGTGVVEDSWAVVVTVAAEVLVEVDSGAATEVAADLAARPVRAKGASTAADKGADLVVALARRLAEVN